MPQNKEYMDSRAPSAYGDPYGFDQPRSRMMSPATSYQDIKAQGRAASFYVPPVLPYGDVRRAGSPHGSYAGSVFGDQRSLPGDGAAAAPGAQRFHSFYAQPAAGSQDSRGSSYSLAGQPLLDHRASSYSLAGAAASVAPGPSPWSQPGTRNSSYSFAPPAPMGPSSRQVSMFLPEGNIDNSRIDMGEATITDAQLERSIRRICQGADLDTLTKKSVRKTLEQEYGVDLTPRKDSINRIIEQVLNGE